jgi:hypothetical protein
MRFAAALDLDIDGLTDFADRVARQVNPDRFDPADRLSDYILIAAVFETGLRKIVAGDPDPVSIATAALRALREDGGTITDVLRDSA